MASSFVIKTVTSLIICALTTQFVVASNTANQNTSTLINFEEETNNELKNWLIVNDSVMGGRSNSQFEIDGTDFIFSGNVSMQNNGGFASVRRRLTQKESIDAIAMKLIFSGDEKTYKLRFRVNGYLDGPAYETTITTDGTKQSIEFNTQTFKAIYRSRTLPNAALFDFSNALQLEIMIADKQPGDFKFVIHEIEFLR